MARPPIDLGPQPGAEEYGTVMRERSQPEYLYTAAAVGSFGAVCLVAAALRKVRRNTSRENQKDILIALLAEYGAAMRERSQPEYLYTVAAVGSFGAVCLVAASLHPELYHERTWTHPASVAAIGIILIAVFVIAKIVREHQNYARLKHSRAKVARCLKEILGGDDLISDDLLNPISGCGYIFSAAVIVSSAFGSFLFLLALFS
jgi:hypothetical protein